MDLVGMDQVRQALAELPKATNKNVIKRATISAAEPMAEYASDLAPVAEGDLAEGLTVTTKIVASQAGDSKRPGPDAVRAFVGPNYSKGSDGYAPHAHLVEFGTGPRFHKSGKFVGEAPAQPFMRPAFDARRMTFIERWGEAVWEEIDKAQKRLARKKAKAVK